MEKISKLVKFFLEQDMDETILIDSNGHEISRINFINLINKFSDILHNHINNSDKVIIWGSNTIENVVIIFTAIFSDIEPILINDNSSHEEVCTIKGDIKASYIISDKERKLEDKFLLTFANEVTTDNSCIDHNSYKSILHKFEENISLAIHDLSSTCLLLPTSGTTSMEKIVMLSYDNIINAVDCTIKNFDLNRNTTELLAFPINTITGLVCQLLSVILAGGKVALYDKFFSINSMIKFIDEANVNYLVLTPSVLNQINVENKKIIESLNRVSHIVICGERIYKNSWSRISDKFPNITITPSYGLTELTGCVSSYDSIYRKSDDYAGKVFDVMNVKIVDGNNNFIQDYQTGEVVISSPTLMKGYLDNTVTNKCLIDNTYFKTGDIGYIDGKDLYITGRLKNVAIISGRNVSLESVENVLLSNKNINNVRVYSKRSNVTGEKIVADVVLKIGCKCSKEDIFKYCLNKLEGFMIPKEINLVSRIELNNSLKISRR